MATRANSSPVPPGAALIAAFEGAWAEIRRRHPEVPGAVLITGSGSDGPRQRHSLRLGHFAASRWREAEGETSMPEIFIGGEGFTRGPGPVLATLLHEAAHAVANVRGIKDTSRQGRYHNQRFKAIAEELGLEIERDSRIGWSLTALPPETAAAYGPTITQLEKALTVFRRQEVSGATAKSRNAPACVCGCGRRIRVARGVLALGPILCGACGEEFVIEEREEPDANGAQPGGSE